MSEFDDVGTFHARFGLPTDPGPRDLPMEVIRFRSKFMQEELDEFNLAAIDGNHAGMFDALIDLVYVACGTAHFLGYPWQEGWDLVQAANMAKVRAASAEQSKRGSAFDVVKPEGWQAPDIEGLLESKGWTVQ